MTGHLHAHSYTDLEESINTLAAELHRSHVIAERALVRAQSVRDGTDGSGRRLPAGSYAISASHAAADGGGKSSLETYVRGTVDSVTVGTDGLYLDLPGLGTVPLDYVLRVS